MGCEQSRSIFFEDTSLAPYSRVRNKHSPMLINFLTFFQGLRPYSGLHRGYFSGMYKYKVKMGLRFLPNFPEATFIQGATS